LAAVFSDLENRRDALAPFLGVFENQDAAVVQMDFRCLPCLALVDAVGIGIGGIPGTVEPIKIRFFVGDPFLDRLPRWLDGFHGLDVERRRRWARKLNKPLPKPVETEEEFDLLGPFDGADEFHGSFATGALERIGTPDFEDEVAPEGTHGTGALLRGCGDEEDLGFEI